MKRLVFLLLSIAMASSMGATAQAPDELKIGGKTYSIHTNPLRPYLAAHPDKLPEPEVISTGMWRGYIATFSIRKKQLFVDDVRMLTKASMDSDAPESERYRSVMKELFGSSAPRVATWFTGHLIVPTGEMVSYIHMGYGSTYSSYLIVTVVKGEVRKQRERDLEQFNEFRRAQYEAYKKTPEYAQVRASATKGEEFSSEERLESFLYQYTSEEYLSRVFEQSPP